MCHISSIKPNLDPLENQSQQGSPAESVLTGIRNKPTTVESVETGLNKSSVKYVFNKPNIDPLNNQS